MASSNFKSVSTRFVIFLACIMTFVFLLFSVIITKINLLNADNKIDQRLKELTTIAKSSLPVSLWQLNYEHMNDFVDTLFLYEDISLIQVIDGEKVIIQKVKEYASFASPNEIENDANFASISEDLEYGGLKIGVIYFVVDKTIITRFIIQNILQAITGLLIIIITASFAAYYFIRKTIIKPIQRLENATVAIAMGDLDVEININSKDEIGHLAKNLNEMRVAIKDFIEKMKGTDHLKETNRLLQNEIKVKEITQKSLERSEDRFRYVLNHSVDTIYNLNIDTNTFDYISPSCLKAFGFTQEEFHELGLKGTLELLHPEDRPRLIQHYKKLLSISSDHNFSSAIEYRFKHKVLGHRWIQDTRSIVFDPQGRPISIVGSARDITEKKLIEIDKQRLEEQLNHTQKIEAIGTMAGGISHDFNNILSAILGYADMAQDDCSKDSSTYSDLEEIITAGNRAKRLVQQILAFSKREINEHATIRIEPVFRETLRLLRATTPANIEIQYHIASDCGCIMADSTKIHQVLMNLCVNAAQSLDAEGGKIEMELAPVYLNKEDVADQPDFLPGRYLMLSVADNGPGISPEIITRIFDPYFTTKKTGKGSGMGLAVVMGIIKSTNGLIKVKSQPRSKTCFQVFFPETEEEAEFTDELPILIEHGTGHVLIVDDELSIAKLVRRRIENLGLKGTITTSSKKALKLFQKKPDHFDVVISDQTMPEMTGDQLALELRKIRNDIPIIICSGFNERLSTKRLKELGISFFLLKPVEKHEFANAIRKTLTGKV